MEDAQPLQLVDGRLALDGRLHDGDRTLRVRPDGVAGDLAFIIGAIILYVLNNLTGVAGQREKVPFPVFARASFGVFGANIPAVLRAIVAVFWYGIQT